MKPLLITKIAFATTLIAVSLPNDSTAADGEKPWAWRGQTIDEFDESLTEVLDWQVVNDGVMGGLSKGNVEITDEGTMKFTGTLSLENNGGFSTVRSSGEQLDLSNDSGILLRVKGDGREYDLRLDSDATYRGMPVSFAGKFIAEKGDWQEVKIPWSAFEGSWRGTDLPNEKLNPAVIRRAGVLLGDKKNGPFNLEIDYIRTYGKGKGAAVEAPITKAKPTEKTKASSKSASLIATAVADGRFNTLKAALDAAGLTTFFQWDNKLTVFAPTDEAFAKLPKGTVENLLKPENKEQLVAILSYHVFAGSAVLADALRDGELKTVEGTSVRASFSDGRVRINDASVLDADIKCTDGIIHVIDTVLMLESKPKPKNLLTTAEGAGSFTTLLAAAKAAGLVPALEGKDPLTVFAPTDEAFATLPKGTVESLLKEENRGKLIKLLTTHVVSGKVSAGDALNAGKAKSLSGAELNFSINNGTLNVNGSAIRTTGIDGGNGIIHVISSVIGFPEIEEKTASSPTASVTNADATKLIIAAIERGVPLYNRGDIAECAEIYENCILALSENSGVPTKTREMLSKVADAGKEHDVNRRAWIYRSALDKMFAVLETQG
ncbi:CIA30 family protein [Verrucomicrobiales bacterium]|nr:CIA30 family protein [Verrucomicrobiales bacterium]